MGHQQECLCSKTITPFLIIYRLAAYTFTCLQNLTRDPKSVFKVPLQHLQIRTEQQTQRLPTRASPGGGFYLLSSALTLYTNAFHTSILDQVFPLRGFTVAKRPLVPCWSTSGLLERCAVSSWDTVSHEAVRRALWTKTSRRWGSNSSLHLISDVQPLDM